MKRFQLYAHLLIFLFFFPCTIFSKENLRRSPVVIAVQKASPAVVNISTEKVVRVRENPFYKFHFDPFSSMEDFMKNFFSPGEEKKSVPNSLGSGVIVDDMNHVLTNNHVIASASKIKVTLIDKREFDATLVGADPASDLAILKIDSKQKLPKVPMGTASDLMIGETIIAIGNPFGLSNTVTTGVISAKGRTVKAGEHAIFENFIQTDASINPGNSGGALLNIEGKLIGINTAIVEKAQGIGFAIPIDNARKIMRSLLTYGEVPPIWLGFKVSSRRRAIVYYLEKGGPAELAGIRLGDIITKVGKIEVEDATDFSNSIARHTINDQIPMSVKRKNKTLILNLRAKAFPRGYSAKIARENIGIAVVANTKSNRTRLKVRAKKGVIVSRVLAGTPAKKIGFNAGDIIRAVDGKEINSIKDFNKAMLRIYYKESTTLVIERGNYIYKVPVTF